MRRRSLLGGGGAASLLAGQAAAAGAATGEVRWYIGEGDGRTDPFVTWTVEIMQARFGLRVRPSHECEMADLLTLARAQGTDDWPISWRGSVVAIAENAGNPAGARALACFLATPQACAHARCLTAFGLGDS